MSSKVINTTATPPPVDSDLLEISSDLADFRLDHHQEAGLGRLNEPVYMGICLPRNILNLFPRRSPAKPCVGVELDVPSVVTSEGDEVDNVVPPEGVNLCLNCSRTTTTTANNKTSSCSSSSTSLSTGDLSKHHKKLIMLRNVTDSKRIKGQGTSEGVDEEDHTFLAILVNVQRCANPVLMKQAKMNLLELKQKHNECFMDHCLYSEVLKAIGRNTYRQASRRFLQELFLDIEFEGLLGDVMDRLNLQERRQVVYQEKTVDEVKDTTSYGSMTVGVELRNGKKEFERIVEEGDVVDGGEKAQSPAVRMSLPEPILSPTRSTASGDSSETNGGAGGGGKWFTRVALSCSVNKFPVKRDRANSLNTPTTAKDY